VRLPPGSRRVPVVVGAVALVLVSLCTYQYWRARVALADVRGELADAQGSLATLRGDVSSTQGRTGLTGEATDLIQTEIGLAVDTRAFIDTIAGNTLARIAEVKAKQEATDVALFLVAAHANETQACFNGMSRAIDANRRGDQATAVDALQDAADPCARTLALASGARFPYDFADPHVLRVGSTYYGYSTNAGAGDVQTIRSTDLVTWSLVGNALRSLPAWAKPNATWAPAVFERNGRYVMYYTVRETSSDRQCISRAVATNPAGPFVDDSAGPLVCQRGDGGSIDPSPFVDADGRAYLLWKSEGQGAAPATLWSQELTPDGLGLTGPAHPLLSADRPFEAGTVEAPSMVHANGAYFLLYSAADWGSRSYSTAYATCTGPAGPCTKPPDGRLLRSGPRLAGPGGAAVFFDQSGAPWLAYHAYTEPNVGYPSSRYLHLTPLHLANGHPNITHD
jgi:beta-xylosidase